MSFGFSGIGTKEEVAAQLKAAQITTGKDGFNEFGAELRDLLVKHFGAERADAGHGHEYRYAVKAGGHGGGNSALYVELKVEAHWVTVPADEDGQVVDASIDDDED